MDKNIEIDKLDENICTEFREAVVESPILSEERELTDLYNLCCVVMDRLDTSVRYLNNHWSYPNSEEEFICFIMFACMLNDGVNMIYKRTIGGEPVSNFRKKYFLDACRKEPVSMNEEECPTDESFFEYFRSISIAHPYETNRNKSFKNIFGTQVSPWVIANKHTLYSFHCDEPVGVRLYASKRDEDDWDSHDIVFSFDCIKGFISEKYGELKRVTEWVKKNSEEVFSEWRKVKVNRSGNPEQVLRNICEILDQRHESTYSVERLLEELLCPISNTDNLETIKEYRGYIESHIPQICDSVDSMNSMGNYEVIIDALSIFPNNLHRMAYYQLEKIFTYLNEKHEYISPNSNEMWGLIQAERFYQEFAKKWVVIDVKKMDYQEIKLLVRTALYLESKEQGLI